MKTQRLLETDKITEQERLHVDIAGNLSDAQVYLPLSQAQLAAVPGPAFFATPRSEIDIGILKQRFFRALSVFHGGLSLPPAEEWFICYSASNAIEITANVLRKEGLGTVGLLHPTFDATCHMLRRHGMHLRPVEDSTLAALCSGSGFKKAGLGDLDALFLTLPNNPSGRDLSAEDFRALARAARAENVVLVIDACFRAYSAPAVQHHDILVSEGADAIVIEDSGKLFNLKDIKLGAAWCLGRLRRPFHNVHCDFILDAPIFSLECITCLLVVSKADYGDHLRAIVRRNRAAAVATLSARGLVAVGSDYSNIQLFELPPMMKAQAIADEMTACGVGVVVANAFFWDLCDGEYIRLALARTPDEFDRHIEVLSNCLKAAKEQPAAWPVC